MIDRSINEQIKNPDAPFNSSAGDDGDGEANEHENNFNPNSNQFDSCFTATEPTAAQCSAGLNSTQQNERCWRMCAPMLKLVCS